MSDDGSDLGASGRPGASAPINDGPVVEPRDSPKGPTSPEATSGASGRRRRRWPWWVLAVLLLLGAAATFVVWRAPGFIAARMKARLSNSWAAAVEIDRVEIAWSRMSIHAYGLRFDDEVRLKVEIESVEIDLSWNDLWDSPRPTIVVNRPVITFEAKPAPAREQPEQDLAAFESIEIIDGSLELVLSTQRGPTSVELTGISATVENRRSPGGDRSAALDLDISAHAAIGATGALRVEGRTSSSTPATAWRVRFELERFELATLNRLWLDIVEMDVDRGYLNLDGELSRSLTRLRGRIRPRFEEVTMLGADEQALHPMAEALFGHMLMGARSTISIDREMTGEPSSLSELLDTDWQTLLQGAIKRGYARRLSTLRGFTATIGDVRVDFGQGLLQLFDVVVDTEQPVIDTPLVSIDQVDVLFDPAVTQAGSRAYKHVTLWRPTLTFATGVEGSNNRLQFDESWVDTISAIPFPTRDLVVHEGRIDLWDIRHEEPVNISVSEIELEGQEMARDLHPAGVRGARLDATAVVLDEADASVHVVYEPRAAIPNLDMDMKLEPLALTTLAPALQVFVGVDAVGGRVGLSAHLSARNYEITAKVVPDVQRPKLRTLGRGRALRKMILGRALRRMQSHMIEMRYSMEPDEGLLNKFFPQLIQAVFLGR